MNQDFRRASLAARTRNRSRARAGSFLEPLEPRQMLALAGVAPLSELPLSFYNSTGRLNYDAPTQALDVAATPTTIFLPTGPVSLVDPQHGDFQIHARVNSSGNLVGGVNAGDSAVLGAVNAAGNDLIVIGSADLDNSGTIDANETGVLLSGEITAFGYQDTGAGDTTDFYDFRFTPTGGALASYFAGKDIGVLLTSENSTFDGSFSLSFLGQAKGTYGPKDRPLGSLSGYKYQDRTGNGQSADDAPLGGTTIYLDLNNNNSPDASEPKTVTDDNGFYQFNGLAPGQYTVREVVPSGFVRTTPAMVNGYTVNVTAGEDAGENDFANFKKCDCISNVCNITYIINGKKTVTDLRGNTNQGDEVKVRFTIKPGAMSHAFTLVSYTAPGSSFVAGDAYLQQIYDIDTGVFGPGTHCLTVMIPDCYYQIDFVCGEAIDKFGPAGSNIFYSAQMRLLSADNDGCVPCLPNAGRISGGVFIDNNNNGSRQDSEAGIAGVKVTLIGTDYQGRSVNITKWTNWDGLFKFENLRPGTYKVSQYQPAGFTSGQVFAGSLPGTVSGDTISAISLGGGADDAGLTFAERLPQGASPVLRGDLATTDFWDSSNGQKLIKAFNGSSSAKNLGNWLGNTFPNIYGSSAGSSNLKGKTNTQVATFFQTTRDESDVEAQTLAMAISLYASNTGLAGGDYAEAFGFSVSGGGIGGKTINVGSNGVAFGVNNNTVMSVSQILQAVNAQSVSGVLYKNNLSRASKCCSVLDTANDCGGLC